MRNILIFISMTVFTSICKAQSTIVPLNTNYYDTVEGAYFKDLSNELNPFVGTWKWTEGSSSITIILQKKEMNYSNNYYQDLLIGEYRYVENGVEKVNTLSHLDTSLTPGFFHGIFGRRLINTDYFSSPCSDCDQNEKRAKLTIVDPERMYLPSASITIRHLSNQGLEKIKINIHSEHGGIIPINKPNSLRMPFGEFILIKQ